MSDLGWQKHFDDEEAANIARYGDPDHPYMWLAKLKAAIKWVATFLVAILLAIPVGAEVDD